MGEGRKESFSLTPGAKEGTELRGGEAISALIICHMTSK